MIWRWRRDLTLPERPVSPEETTAERNQREQLEDMRDKIGGERANP